VRFSENTKIWTELIGLFDVRCVTTQCGWAVVNLRV